MAKSMPKQQPGRSKQDVRTPKVFLSAVKHRLGIDAFIVDLAASQSNTVANQFYSERSNALVQSWVFPDGYGWLNPPFSDLRPWVKKAWEEMQLGARFVMLVPTGVGSNWWRDFVHSKVRVLLLNGRIQFVGHTHGYPKDLALLIYEPGVIPAYEIWTWANETQRKDVVAGDLDSAAFNDALYLEPDACTIQLVTDEAGAACIAAGLVPRYLKDQARELLALAAEQKRVPA